ncbi:pyridoxamine 5'-phosphate oxidase family protein [Pseudonocardia acaciae]|uniref:pyridoxamine 5'-phosphate oxidase family protein n=1 Tax=Pseudonocardia acaciae TaxID=551276 RepID=UPI001FDED398|nr:pyridoxamine 5'-phosphate oxidase family protein [Pseudonocardia acaciae]
MAPSPMPTPRPSPRPSPVPRPSSPGSRGEHELQCAFHTEDRAARFYADQVRDRLLPAMVEFVGRMEMAFVATSDSGGECDASLRAGPPGFIQVLDERHVAYPEYRGNGVHASLGNITENPHVGLLMVDFERDLIGLHVNGRARIVADEELRAAHAGLGVDDTPGRRAERWVVVEVEEAYIHCRKHIPRMARVHDRRDWGTDDPARKGGDYFGAKAERAAEANGHGGTSGHTNGHGGGANGHGGTAERADGPPRGPFPSTTHLPAGAATARPLRPAPKPAPPPPRRRFRWLGS